MTLEDFSHAYLCQNLCRREQWRIMWAADLEQEPHSSGPSQHPVIEDTRQEKITPIMNQTSVYRG